MSSAAAWLCSAMTTVIWRPEMAVAVPMLRCLKSFVVVGPYCFNSSVLQYICYTAHIFTQSTPY